MLRNYSERLHWREATKPDVTYTFGGSVVETPVEMPVLDYDPTQERNSGSSGDILVGMYYYDDGTFGTEVKTGHIIGVVVIPAEATPDKNVRIAPLYGAVNSISWSDGITSITDLAAAGVTTEVRSFPNTVNNGVIYEASQGVYENTVGNVKYPYFYMEAPDELVNIASSNTGITVVNSTLNPNLTLIYYTEDFGEDGGALPVPYLQDGSVNPDFVVEGTMTADWTSSEENMQALKDSGSNNVFNYTYNFANGIPAGKWHVPTITELLFIYGKLKTIVDAYTAAGAPVPFYYSEDNYIEGWAWSGSYFGRYNSGDSIGTALLGRLYSHDGGTVRYDDVADYDDYTFGVPLATIDINTQITAPVLTEQPPVDAPAA